MTTAPPKAAHAVSDNLHRRKWWQPHMWAGCGFPAWMRLLARHHFAVDRGYVLNVSLITLLTGLHSALRGVQQVIYGRRIRRTRIRQAPIFIIGHWRSGTTLLHELLALDERHSFPTTYACMEPNHFLLSERFFTRWLPCLLPARRPMDNMAFGFDRPQEDEFALCMLGQPSPCWQIAFPNYPPQAEEYADLETLPPAALECWKRTLLRFLQELTVRDQRRLVLKSPLHACRIKTLLELFPDARFIHIVRDPYVVFPSTLHLWKSVYSSHALQKPSFAGLERQILDGFDRHFRKLEEGRKLIHPGRFYELRYEDLAAAPAQSMARLYAHLQLGGFERLLPRLKMHLAEIDGYQTNGYQLSAQQRAQIADRWGWIIEKYGYGSQRAVTRPARGAAALSDGGPWVTVARKDAARSTLQKDNAPRARI